MLKVLLIDDEIRATDSLRLIIERLIPEITEVRACNDSRLASRVIHDYQPALVFLDIQMPYLNGFQLLEKLPNKNFKIIFTTAYNEYAIEAIRFSAFDYLLKPIDIEELKSAIDRLLRSKEDYKQQYELLKNIMHNFQLPSSDEFRLALPTMEGVFYFQPSSIIRCEAIGNYTKFFIEGGKSHVISKTLGEYDTLLTPYHFIRTHRSHLVNRKFIAYLDHEGYIILSDDSKVEVSRRRKEDVMAAMR